MSMRHTDPNLNMTPDPIPPRDPITPRNRVRNDSYLGLWAFGLLVLCCAVVASWAWWGGYWNPLGLAGNIVPNRILKPEYPTDRVVTISGKVDQVLSPNEFIITDAAHGQHDVTVVLGDASKGVTSVKAGDHVRITGQFQAPDRSGGEESSDTHLQRRMVFHATSLVKE